MADLYTQLKDYEARQARKFPTSGTIQGIDGGFVDVFVPASSTILRNVKVVGTPSSNGQQVVLSWENGQPTAHVTGGSASSGATALIRGPQGPQGEQGPAGSPGAQGPQGPAGSLTASSPVELVKLASTPANPPAGSIRLYPKMDDTFYKKTSSGVETQILDRGTPIYYTETIGSYLARLTVPANTTYHGTPFRVGMDANAANFPWPDGGVLSEMTLRTATTNPSGAGSGTLVATLLIDNVASSIIVTVPVGAAFGSYTDNVHSETIAPGGTLRWEFRNNATGLASCQLTAITMKLKKQVTF